MNDVILTFLMVAAVVGGYLGLAIRFARKSSDPAARGFVMTMGGCAALLLIGVAVLLLIGVALFFTLLALF